MASPRETFERQLQALTDEVLVMGSLVEDAIMQSVEALRMRDLEASRRIYMGDTVVNQKRYDLENQVINLIATQQPMARDLRFLAAVLEIITELERIGDYAKGISKINLMLGPEPLISPLVEIPRMSEKGLDMLHRALGAFVARDVDTARQIPLEDDDIDYLYNQVYHEMLKIMIAAPSTIDRANYLIWAAHNLERMSDRVTNICERIVYAITGEIKELDQAGDVEMFMPNQ